MPRSIAVGGVVCSLLLSGAGCKKSEPGPEPDLTADVLVRDASRDAERDGGPPLPPRICRTPGAAPATWFTEITGEVGLKKTSSLEPLANLILAADLDGDGWQDFFAATASAAREPAGSKRTRFLFMNRPDPGDPKKRIFVDAIDESGLLATRDGAGGRGLTSVSFADLDNDGDLDAVGCCGEISTNLKDGCAAFLNDGKAHFKLAPAGDLETDLFSSPSQAMLDFDRDGIIDLWPGTVGKWQYGPAAVSRPRLYKGAGDGTFKDVSLAMGLPQNQATATDYRINMGVTSCDFDLDGDRDVLLADYGVPIGPNHVYQNDGQAFTDVATQLGVRRGPAGEGGFTFCIACGDIDDDGDVDLMTAELHHAWYPKNDYSELLVNDAARGAPPHYVRPGRPATGLTRPHTGNLWTEGDAQVFFADVDLDGRKDIYIVSLNYPQQNAEDPDWTHSWLYQQRADHRFEDVTVKTPWADPSQQSLGDSALVDLDNDGDLDVITGTGTYNSEFLGLTNAIHVYRNEVGQASNFARIRIAGKGKGASNGSGIGARVEIIAGGQYQQQEVLGSHGGTQTDVYLNFGLGKLCEIDTVIVHWPSARGEATRYEHVLANYLVEIREGEPQPVYRNLDGSTPK